MVAGKGNQMYHILGDFYLPDPAHCGLQAEHYQMAISVRPLLAQLAGRDLTGSGSIYVFIPGLLIMG